MKLDWILTGAAEAPIARLFDFSRDEALTLQELVRNLASREIVQVELADFEWIQPLNDCRLTLSVRTSDVGVFAIGSVPHFECALRWQTWDNIEFLIGAFTLPTTSGGFHWLWVSCPGEEPGLLMSVTGRW